MEGGLLLGVSGCGILVPGDPSWPEPASPEGQKKESVPEVSSGEAVWLYVPY